MHAQNAERSRQSQSRSPQEKKVSRIPAQKERKIAQKNPVKNRKQSRNPTSNSVSSNKKTEMNTLEIDKEGIKQQGLSQQEPEKHVSTKKKATPRYSFLDDEEVYIEEILPKDDLVQKDKGVKQSPKESKNELYCPTCKRSYIENARTDEVGAKQKHEFVIKNERLAKKEENSSDWAKETPEMKYSD